MTFTHLLLTSLPRTEKLLEYGFRQDGESFVLNRKVDDDFYALVTYDSKNLDAEVYETDSNEKYALLDVKTAHGKFVNGIRKKVTNLLNDIAAECFENMDVKSKYVHWLEDELQTKGEYPWEDDTTSAVYRCKNQKWFALVMKLKFKNLGFESDEPVWAVNLKTDADKIPQLVDKKSIFPAWHMNKKYWITILLTTATDFEKLKSLTLRSKELVEFKK